MNFAQYLQMAIENNDSISVSYFRISIWWNNQSTGLHREFHKDASLFYRTVKTATRIKRLLE